MKTVRFIFLFLLSMIAVSTIAQNLDKMKESDRNAYLIKTAKEVIMKRGPGYYREYKAPIIERRIVSKGGDYSPKNEGRAYYRVTYLYDESKEQLEWDFAARVDIWADTGIPSHVDFGNGFGYVLDIERQTKSTSEEVMPYRQARPRVLPPTDEK